MRKVLVVDDYCINREYLRDCILEYYPDTLVYESFNGEDAVEKFKAQRYDLVLLDIMMPVMDGCEALKIMKKLDSTVPVIMATCYEAKYLETYAQGVDGFLLKPFTPQDLINAIEKYFS